MRSIRCIAIRAREMWLNKSALNDNIHIRIVAAFFELFFDQNGRGGYERTREVRSIGPHGRMSDIRKKNTT
jgi:hypothetical protein